MTSTANKLHILLPVHTGGSGGFIRHITEAGPRWLLNPRVEEVVLHAPSGLLSAIDKMDIEVKRYTPRRLGPFSKRFAPLIQKGDGVVALCVTARPVRLAGMPLVTMVRNVEPIQHPEYGMPLFWRIRLWALRRETIRACHEATRVIAVSQYVKERLCALGVSAAKVDVVYHGGSLPTMKPQRPPACAAVNGPFIFSAGSMVPYRGYEDLIRAVAVIKEKEGNPPAVVVGGSGGGLAKPYERWVRALSTSLGVDEHLIWAGQLSEPEMTWCFRHAAAVVQTSKAESFCMFQVEALWSGALIISSTQPPMPEILGEAAIYYRPGDAAELARAISKCLSMSEAEAAVRRQIALARASMFTWDQTACQTLDSLEAAREDFARAKR